MVDLTQPFYAPVRAYAGANRPRRYAAMGYGFSGEFDTIEEAMTCIRSMPSDWPCALYERIPFPQAASTTGVNENKP